MELLKVSNITKVYNTGKGMRQFKALNGVSCLLYTSPSPRD